MQLDLPFLRSSTPATPAGAGIEFVRVPRARRYILRVRPDGGLRVTVPRWGSKREALAFVETQRRWIERQRARVRADHAPREWSEGTRILLDGEAVRIAIEESSDRRAVRYGGRLIPLPNGVSVRDAVEADLRELARAQLVPRLQSFAAQHGLRVGRVTIRNQQSRWGSCSRTGSIALNFRLVQTPLEVRDYVLLHELMHLHEQNHSRRFWRLVEAACPGFREAERWLKQQGRSLF